MQNILTEEENFKTTVTQTSKFFNRAESVDKIFLLLNKIWHKVELFLVESIVTSVAMQLYLRNKLRGKKNGFKVWGFNFTIVWCYKMCHTLGTEFYTKF